MSDFETEFPINQHCLYLNHAAVAPWPSRTQQAVAEFAQENALYGASHYERWLRAESLLRQQMKTLINAPSSNNIAFQKNTSEGLSVIAYGLEWQPGDNVIITNQEFPSNRIVWESLSQFGVTVKEADIGSGNPEQAIIDQMDENTRLVSVSSVQFGTGLTLDLHPIGQRCRERSVLFCVDAIQSIGVIPLDVQAIQADFVVADGHKWMLGPEGIALFYVREEVRSRLKVLQYGWHMIANPGNYDDKAWTLAESAKRFECGSPNMLGVHGLSASLSLLLDVGIERVHTLVNKRVQYLVDRLQQKPEIEILSPIEQEKRAGIVTFRSNSIDNHELFQQLKAKNVVCALRGGGIRFSPHFHTPENVLENALKLIP